jgi:hypothetical protein
MTKQTRIAVLLLVIAWLVAVPSLAQEGQIKAIAEDALTYGSPMVMNYGVMDEAFIDKTSSQYKCPFNQLYNTARVFTPKDTAVVTPNSDTPYTFFCADLRAEPVVFTVPTIENGRYYSVQLIDWYTFNFGYVGSRTTANAVLVIGPGSGSSRRRSTNTCWPTARTAVSQVPPRRCGKSWS